MSAAEWLSSVWSDQILRKFTNYTATTSHFQIRTIYNTPAIHQTNEILKNIAWNNPSQLYLNSVVNRLIHMDNWNIIPVLHKLRKWHSHRKRNTRGCACDNATACLLLYRFPVTWLRGMNSTSQLYIIQRKLDLLLRLESECTSRTTTDRGKGCGYQTVARNTLWCSQKATQFYKDSHPKRWKNVKNEKICVHNKFKKFYFISYRFRET